MCKGGDLFVGAYARQMSCAITARPGMCVKENDGTVAFYTFELPPKKPNGPETRPDTVACWNDNEKNYKMTLPELNQIYDQGQKQAEKAKNKHALESECLRGSAAEPKMTKTHMCPP